METPNNMDGRSGTGTLDDPIDTRVGEMNDLRSMDYIQYIEQVTHMIGAIQKSSEGQRILGTSREAVIETLMRLNEWPPLDDGQAEEVNEVSQVHLSQPASLPDQDYEKLMGLQSADRELFIETVQELQKIANIAVDPRSLSVGMRHITQEEAVLLLHRLSPYI